MVLLLTVLAKESEMFCLAGGGGEGREGEERKGTGRGAKRMI